MSRVKTTNRGVRLASVCAVSLISVMNCVHEQQTRHHLETLRELERRRARPLQRDRIALQAVLCASDWRTVLELDSMLSSVPIRVNTRSMIRRDAYRAGTKHPIWPRMLITPTCRRYVLFPLMFGPWTISMFVAGDMKVLFACSRAQHLIQ